MENMKKESKNVRSIKPSGSNKVNKKRKLVIGLIVIIALVIIVPISAYKISIGPVDKGNNKEIVVDIEPGSSTSAIAHTLKESGTVKSEFFFKLKSKFGGYDGKFQAGRYGFSQNMSAEEQMQMMSKGETLGKMFTVIEGTNSKKIGQALEHQGIIKAKEFYRELETGKFDYEFLKNVPEGPGRLDGFLCPETYKFEPGDSAHSIIDKMLKQFEKVYNEKYKSQLNGKDIHKIMTVASIVEREAKTDQDKENVASVIYNRLDIKMPLQMDSILAYITGEDKIKASLDDTKVKSSYNPYQNKGLPPGPICSPGDKAIQAAINPPKTKYIYFVATEKLDGTNVFSETYDQFLKDKEKFDKAYKEYIKKNPGKK